MGYTIADFLEIRTAGSPGFNHDGTRVLLSSNLTGTTQLYRTSRDGRGLVQVTDLPEPCSGLYRPGRDEILVQTDDGGNERFQIFVAQDAERAELRPVVHDPDFIHVLGGVSRDGRLIAYRTNRRNGTDFDVVVRDLDTGEERVAFDRGGWANAAGFSPDGRFVAVLRSSERNMDNDLFLVDLGTLDVLHVTPHEDESSYSSPSWLPDGSAFYFTADENREFAAVARYDLRAGRWDYVVEREWGVSCHVDWPGRRLLVHHNEEGYSRLELLDAQTLQPAGEVALPHRGIVSSAAFSRDGRALAFAFTSPVEPGDVWCCELETGELQRLTTSPNAIPPEEFVQPELHRFESFDGESIPVFAFLPRGGGAARPVVVSVHGGPESQYRPSFNPITQYFVHRGYAVLAPNVRGSTGYGKRYHHLDDVHRRLDSVNDMAGLHAWIASRAELDESRSALMGGSYGGYMVLAGLAFQPDLWAAAVDIVGISNFVTFLENTSSWRRVFREREYGSLERDRDLLRDVSPITHVDRMRAPLFVIHGRNDPRVPLSESEQIRSALQAKGYDTELLVYGDEGHGLQKLKNRLDAYPKVADFLDRILLP